MDASAIPGRVVVTARAIETVFSALAAEELGTTARSTRVRVRDDGGSLSVAVRAPVAAGSADPTAPGSTVLERVEAARRRIHTTGPHLTGAVLADVTIRVTDITTESEKRAL